MIKNFGIRILNFLARVIRYLRVQSRDREDLHFILWKRAATSSADYVESRLGRAILYDKREALWNLALSCVRNNGIFVEFGVFAGVSINHFARHSALRGKTIYGFDSFEGLKEDWFGTGLSKGAFNREGKLPTVANNVVLLKGWFDQTIPGFLQDNKAPLAFVHFDADTYESTKQVLNLIAERIVPGTVIVFDEYLGFPNWQNGEFKAWSECVNAKGLRYEYIAFAPQQAAIRIN